MQNPKLPDAGHYTLCPFRQRPAIIALPLFITEKMKTIISITDFALIKKVYKSLQEVFRREKPAKIKVEISGTDTVLDTPAAG